MTNEEIKKEVEVLSQTIKESTEAIEELRKNCPHEHWTKGVYSWRIGCADEAWFCSYCGQFISYYSVLNQKI